ncbi:MFS transporter [Microvirga brassicacearum]|uniref:MFS transporter n=1 Tax=Microvirga brassicacearum TaxID=2580413 RepID=A0A5N3PEL6_9HYPH|nr:MFS transporter [Microvirga brassicacearum]KAB0268188.1 MFS transporter [Microvirga brassicacearum]
MNKRLFWLALGTFAIGAEGFVISSLLPQISEDTGVTVVEAGYLVVAFALTYAIGSPILTALTGARDRRRVLTASALAFAIGALGASLAPTYAVLMIARMTIACAAGLYAATAQATAVAISHADHRARAISIIIGGTSLAVAFGAPLGAFIASFAGWRGTYMVIAGAGFTAAAALWVMVPAGLRGDRLSLKARLKVLSQPRILPTLMTTLLYMTGGFAVLTYIAPMAIEAGLGREMLPTVLLIYGIGAAIGNYAGGQMADRWGAQRIVVAALIVNTGMLFLFSVIAHLPASWVGPTFIAMLLPWGITSWSFPPAQASRILAIAPGSAPLALSLNGSALYLGVALGSLIGGLALRFGSAMDLGWVAALFPLAALPLIWLGERSRIQAQPIGGLSG